MLINPRDKSLKLRARPIPNQVSEMKKFVNFFRVKKLNFLGTPFATQCRRPQIFQTMKLVTSNNQSLNYNRLTPYVRGVSTQERKYSVIKRAISYRNSPKNKEIAIFFAFLNRYTWYIAHRYSN